MLKIKELRQKQNITQEKLARTLGLARSTIAMYETGASEPDLKTLNSIANFFGVSVDELLGKTQLPATISTGIPEAVTPEKAKEIWLATLSSATQMLINQILQLDDFQKVRVSTFAMTLISSGGN